jgi:hypothetical protein
MVVEEKITLSQADDKTPATYTVEGSKVLAVYDANGYQVYPEIRLVGDDTVMTVDFGGANSETWKVLKTAAVTFNTSGFVANAAAGSASFTADAAYTAAAAGSATAPAAVSYSNAEAGSATFDADAAYTAAAYEDVDAIADVAYAAPAKAANAEAGSASFTGVASDVVAQDVAADVAAEIAELDYKKA